jgi:hypothetical protein
VTDEATRGEAEEIVGRAAVLTYRQAVAAVAALDLAGMLYMPAKVERLRAVAEAAAVVYDEGLDGVVDGHSQLGIALAALDATPTDASGAEETL